jgi:hypothetical protein
MVSGLAHREFATQVVHAELRASAPPREQKKRLGFARRRGGAEGFVSRG